ncbi:hypothetical protein MPSEU_000491300 [Mayamaea pseudoterrestris]|nr:hypothetical protein MPSEU_000491300 [Mayamaea pseudoterrestris]
MESKPPRKDDRRADGNGSLKDIIIEAGLPADIAAEFADVFGDDRQSASPNTGSWSKKQITMVMAASGVMAFNVMALISLFPVLRGRGAPYLPTKRNNLDRMFAQLHSNDDFRKMATDISKGRPKFVDLGSGDGRVVFRAAREDVFSSCDGFEINPMLHGFAQLRKLLTPKYWKLTQFHLGDIWKVDLADVDVVAVVRF